MATSIADRFWPKVEKTDGCWLWAGATNRGGYGKIGAGARGTGTRDVHRVSWELAFGPIPPGLLVLHRCDVRRCVRPDHLFLGTQRDNVHDARAKGRLRPHPFAQGNREWTKRTTPRGEMHPCARLKTRDVLRIREARAEGQTVREVARAFGVSPQHVSKIARGERRTAEIRLAKGTGGE